MIIFGEEYKIPIVKIGLFVAVAGSIIGIGVWQGTLSQKVNNTTTTISTTKSTIISYFIKGDAKTSIGSWSLEEVCTGNVAVIGYRLKVERPIDDNSALNAISLICMNNAEITSSSMNYGDWRPAQYCRSDSYMIGFQLNSENGPGQDQDKTAANDLVMLCNDGQLLVNSGGTAWGTWGKLIKCPNDTYICGLKTQVDPATTGDKTALNNVIFTCCLNEIIEIEKPNANDTRIIGDALTSYGLWGKDELCYGRSRIIGYQLKVQDPNYDNTALNAIRLICEDNTMITSSIGSSGDWKPIQYCDDSFMIGFQLSSETSTGYDRDMSAANDLLMLCSNEVLLKDSCGAPWGDWGSLIRCPINSYICGLKTLVDLLDSGYDETGLNNVEFICCSYSNISMSIISTMNLVRTTTSATPNAVYLKGDAQTCFGLWGPEELCRNRGQVIGYQLQIRDYSSADNTALNSIRLFCNSGTIPQNITSSLGFSGDWKQIQYCSGGGYMVGFQLSSEKSLGPDYDLTAANDLKMLCNNDKLLTNSSGSKWGTWGRLMKCPYK